MGREAPGTVGNREEEGEEDPGLPWRRRLACLEAAGRRRLG